MKPDAQSFEDIMTVLQATATLAEAALNKCLGDGSPTLEWSAGTPASRLAELLQPWAVAMTMWRSHPADEGRERGWANAVEISRRALDIERQVLREQIALLERWIEEDASDEP